jgi:hypothetical protein
LALRTVLLVAAWGKRRPPLAKIIVVFFKTFIRMMATLSYAVIWGMVWAVIDSERT